MALAPEVMVAAGYEMRVSDAEREAAAAGLREHFASGRLNSDELDQRLTAVFAARTRGDLDALFTDLPTGGHGGYDAGGPAGGRTGAGGPFGTGPFGAGPFGRPGPFGPQGPFGPGPAGASGPGWRASAGRTMAHVVVTSVLIWALLIAGVLGLFGIGAGRPFGLVLLFAAFALVRRLIFIFLGRRRGRVGRGPGRPRGGRRGRRW